MKQPSLLVFALIFSFAMPKPMRAAEGSQGLPAGWEIKVLRLPLEVQSLSVMLPSPDASTKGAASDPNVLPALPSKDAPEVEWIRYLRSATLHFGRMMKEAGVPFPEGSVVVHDPATGTLAVRTTSGAVRFLKELAESRMERQPRSLTFTIDTVQARSELVRQWVTKSAGLQDHTDIWNEITDQVDSGEVKIVSSEQVAARSGQRIKLQRGSETMQVTGVKINKDGHVELLQEERRAGITLEADAVLWTDNKLIDVSLSWEHHFASPTHRYAFSAQSGAQARIEVPVTDFHLARVGTALTMSRGSRRMLAVWAPSSTPAGVGNRAQMQTAFIHAEAVPLLPMENNTLVELLQRYGNKVAPIPSNGPSPVSNESNKFKSTIFNLTSNLGTTQDPFAEKPAATQTPDEALLEELKSSGITLPAGSLLRHSSDGATLFVRTSPELLESVEMLVVGFSCNIPRALAFTLQVIEGEQSAMRKLVQASQENSDHTEMLKAAELLVASGKGRFLETARMETRAGQRMSYEAGEERTMVEGSPQVEVGVSKDGPPEQTPNNSPFPPDPLTVKYETRMIGTRCEIDPVLNSGARSIDVNLYLEYADEPAAPVPAPASAAPAVVAADKQFRMESPATQLHLTEINTSVTMLPGKPRLVGSWVPKGVLGPDGKEVLQAAFLRVDLVPVE